MVTSVLARIAPAFALGGFGMVSSPWRVRPEWSQVEQAAYRRRVNALQGKAEPELPAATRSWREKLREDMAAVKAGRDPLFGYPVHLIDWDKLDA